MDNKTEITICLGSSCFARGNKQTLQAIDTYIKTHKLEEKVYFHGSHCFGKCQTGPVVEINGNLFEEVTPTSVIEILNRFFKNK